jgi:predicted transcriptional regulator of viral defense system
MELRDVEAKIQELFSIKAIVKAWELTEKGINPAQIQRLVKNGKLVQPSRGIYMVPDSEITEHHSILEVQLKVDKGVICLLSALHFHDIGTQLPYSVWIAIPRNAKIPKIVTPRIEVMKFSEPSYSEGITTENIEGVQIKIYSAAKTVADCFKYRNKIGLDVALEALRDVIQRKIASTDEILKYAQICRVKNVIMPYMEAMV